MTEDEVEGKLIKISTQDSFNRFGLSKIKYLVMLQNLYFPTCDCFYFLLVAPYFVPKEGPYC